MTVLVCLCHPPVPFACYWSFFLHELSVRTGEYNFVPESENSEKNAQLYEEMLIFHTSIAADSQDPTGGEIIHSRACMRLQVV